jgi:putative ABC transport system permease protein
MAIGPIFRAMSRNKVRFGLIVAEVALTLAIVANCVTMIRDARTKMQRESGFVDEDLVTVGSQPFDNAFHEDGYLDNSLRADKEALQRVPGVKSVTITRFLPWQGGGSSTEMRVAGTKGEMLRTQIYPADEHTFETLGTPVAEGHSFPADEVRNDTIRLRELGKINRPLGPDNKPLEKFTQEVVISRAFAKLAFGEGSPLGKMLEDSDGDLYRVIGVIESFYNPYGWPIHEYAVFYPNLSRSYDFGSRYLVRAEPGQRTAVAAALESRLLDVNKGRTLQVRTLEEIKSQFFAGQRVVVTLMSGLVGLLLVVTGLGVVGLTSFSVTERTKQIGARRALGARRIDILTQFLLENWLLTAMGTVIGAGLAIALNMALVSGVGSARLGMPLLAAGALLLWIAGLMATLAPALRAARISPAIATRNV